jgi:hypothetical protein
MYRDILFVDTLKYNTDCNFKIFEFPWRPPLSLLIFENQGSDPLRAKGVVILDTGHYLTSHPKDLKAARQLKNCSRG